MATIEELLKDPEGGGIAIVSGEYGEDEKQLIRNIAFQKMCTEIPVDYELGDLDRHGLTMMINDETRKRGCDFKFIGSPRKAMREVRRLMAIIRNTELTVTERHAAVRELTGIENDTVQL